MELWEVLMNEVNRPDMAYEVTPWDDGMNWWMAGATGTYVEVETKIFARHIFGALDGSLIMCATCLGAEVGDFGCGREYHMGWVSRVKLVDTKAAISCFQAFLDMLKEEIAC